MARIVFQDKNKIEALNSIIHPYIWQRVWEELLKAQREGKAIAVLDMPLLLEIGWQLRSESIWVVKVPLEQKIQRVIQRNGVTREEALARIRNQMPTINKLNYADVVIDNSGTIEAAQAQVRQALSKIPCWHPGHEAS